jgi:hypothetical protein
MFVNLTGYVDDPRPGVPKVVLFYIYVSVTSERRRTWAVPMATHGVDQSIVYIHWYTIYDKV